MKQYRFVASSVFRGIIAAQIVLAVALLIPMQVFAAPPSPLTPGSGNAGDLATLFWGIFAVAAIVFVLVESLLIFAIVRYRRRYDDEMPEQIHGNNTLEMIWTIIPTLLLAGIFGLTLTYLNRARNVPAESMVVEVTGHQWYWTFTYPETGLKIDSRQEDLYIPADEPVQFQITGNDVIHSFWVPELNGKYDAIPGHVNVMWIDGADKGTYAGQCAEFCGLSHWNMLFDVVAVPRDSFDNWMDQKVFEASQFTPVGTDVSTILELLPQGDAERGQGLFAGDLGCQTCHSLDGSALVGPSILGVSERAATRGTGESIEEYLVHSIVLPCDYIVDGYTCVMPQNFGTERIDLQGMADLLAYLTTQ